MKDYVQVSENREAEFFLPPDFPIRCYTTCLAEKPGGINPWHWHEELQLLLVTEGTIDMRVEAESYALHAGDGMFLFPELLHSARSADGKTGTYLCFNIGPELFSFFPGSRMDQRYTFPLLRKGAGTPVPLKQDAAWSRTVLEKMRLAETLLRTEPEFYELDVAVLLHEIQKHILMHMPAEDTRGSTGTYKRAEFRQIIAYLQAHYAENVTLDQIARDVCLQKSVCCRLFRQAAQCTIMEYLMQWRIQKSVELLEQTEAPVSMIAEQCGFHNTSYFIRSFRHVMGRSPGQYRIRRRSGG